MYIYYIVLYEYIISFCIDGLAGAITLTETKKPMELLGTPGTDYFIQIIPNPKLPQFPTLHPILEMSHVQVIPYKIFLMCRISADTRSGQTDK